MKKRFLCALLCLTLALCILPGTALAADDITNTGLDLSANPPTVPTTYTAGGGTVVWDPTTSPATLTFNNATVTISNDPQSFIAAAITLPNGPVTVIFNGINSITVTNITTAYAFRRGSNAVFDLRPGSNTTLTSSAQDACGISTASTPVEIKGEGRLDINVNPGFAGYPIYTQSSINLTGGTLAFSRNNQYSGTTAASVTLGGITIPVGGNLDLSAVQGPVTKGASGAVNNGTLLLRSGTTVEQIAALGLTGNGIVRVGEANYTNEGKRLYTSVMDFTMPAASGGWKENATLDADDYTFTGDASSGYTLTLGNLLMEVDDSAPAIRLPIDGPVQVVLTDGTTARITNNGGGIAMQFCAGATEYPCAITGSGKLVMTTNGPSCLETRQPLTITDGDITMEKDVSGSICLDAVNTALVISGGRLDLNANDGVAVMAGSVTLQNDMTVLSPAGAKFQGDKFLLDGSAVAHLILGLATADVPKTGDDMPLLLLCSLLLFSGAGLTTLQAIRKRKRERQAIR